jgi:hypothetical protein
MATTDKDLLQETVRQHTRMAAGAWINGEQIPELGSAAMPEANSDHGNFESSAISKDNA